VSEADLRLWQAWVDRRDEHAFETVVRPHLAFARDFAGRLAKDPADADDAVQQALTRLAMDRSRRPVEVGLRAWLGRSIGLEVRMLARSRARRRKHEAASPSRSAPPAAPGGGSGGAVERALADLPEAQRVAVVLHYLHDVEYAEMAAVLGISETAARVRVHRGIEALRRRLGATAAALVASLPLLVGAGGRHADAAVPAAIAAAESGASLPPLAGGLVGVLVMNKVLAVVGAVIVLGGAAWLWRPWVVERDPVDDAPPPVAARGSESRPGLASAPPAAVPAAPPAAAPAPPAPPPEAAASDDLASQVLESGGQVRLRGGRSAKRGETVETAQIVGLDAKFGGAVPWLSRVGEATNLESLELAGTATGDAEVAALPPIRSLAKLSLNRTRITGQALPHLDRFPALRSLDIGHTKAVGDGLAALGRLESLKELTLQGSAIGDADLAHVGRLSGLVRLDVHDTRITDDGLPHLAGLVALQRLYVHETRVTGRGFAALAGLAALKDVDAEQTRFDDAGLAAIARLPALEDLKLERADVTDAGLAHLRGHPTLDELDLRATRITDAGLEHLAAVPRLVRLELRGTSVTDEGVARLQAALPRVRVSR
jgi:RNA polymerase sigma factor (sigma-70 family)